MLRSGDGGGSDGGNSGDSISKMPRDGGCGVTVIVVVVVVMILYQVFHVATAVVMVLCSSGSISNILSGVLS